MTNVTTDNIQEEEMMRRRGERSFKRQRTLILPGSEGFSSRVRSPYKGDKERPINDEEHRERGAGQGKQ